MMKNDLEKAVLASGCFWGTQFYLQKMKGVIVTRVGYTGGTTINPTYYEVFTGKTGHVEAVLVEYDPAQISYYEILKMFFETHNFSQSNGQGPDIGSQYLSKVFYRNELEQKTALDLINALKEKGFEVATKVVPVGEFYPAEEYHQDYYLKSGGTPYCHRYRKIFD